MDNRTLEEVRKNETKLIEEIKSLEKQLKYLRSGEYYNQLRFERDMLQQVVDTNGVPSEVYDYIDCTHRNTELLKENQALKDRDLIIAAELTKLQDENKQLKDNWNKLKDYIVKEYYIHLPLEASTTSIIILINKMQEIEGGING